MEYKMTMPQLTDTMEEGKIVRWLKKEGDYVKKNEPIVEIESDKAVIEVPSMREGILKKILAEEGEELPVGAPIAIIETETRAGEVEEKQPSEVEEKVTQQPEIKEEQPKPQPEKKEEIKIEIPEEIPVQKLPAGTASPAARQLAARYGIDIQKLQEEGKLPVPAHEKDIKKFAFERYFSKQALEILNEYGLNPEEVYNEINKKKISQKDIEKYIREKNIPYVYKPSDIQSILIKNLSKSTHIPTYHIKYKYDVNYFLKEEEKTGFTLTTYLIKLFGDVLQEFPKLRTVYRDGQFYQYPASNISVAVAVGEELFNPTVKNVEEKSLKDIYNRLKEIKQKAKEKRLGIEDIQGATFSISNLGMFGIEEFDAVLPPYHAAIVAVGKAVDGIITAVFTFDHRVINGAEAAEFVVGVEKKLKDKKYLSSLK